MCVRTLEGHTKAVMAVAWCRGDADGEDGSPTWMVVSGSADKTVRVWDARTGACVHTLEGHTDYVLSVAVHPLGTLLASGSEDNTLKLWS